MSRRNVFLGFIIYTYEGEVFHRELRGQDLKLERITDRRLLILPLFLFIIEVSPLSTVRGGLGSLVPIVVVAIQGNHGTWRAYYTTLPVKWRHTVGLRIGVRVPFCGLCGFNSL